MEPNINIDSSIQVLYGDYKKILSNKIIDVCNKIRETYSEIKWIIYDPYKKVNSYIERIQNALIGTAGRDYGYCDIQNSIIYISTLSIRNEITKNLTVDKMFRIISPHEKTRDFLAEVIMDEIAHIKTKKNHGNVKYDRTLKMYKRKYYNPLFPLCIE